MRRSPIVLAATAAVTAALVTFHPKSGTTSSAGSGTGAVSGGRTGAGSVANTRYGPVQVRVTVRNGRDVEVTALQLPQSDPRSSQISSSAAPLLRQEALSAQSSQIDVVSGATYTSEGYRASLAAALKTAGV